MAEQDIELDALRDLLQEAGAIGDLAKTEQAFTTAYEAFRAEDRKAFQAVLKRRKLLPLCRLVCEWIRLKECFFLCYELCGPPLPELKQPDPRQLAEAVVRFTSDPKVVQRLVAAVEKRDPAAFRRIIKAAELEPFCHFFCHWVCLVRYRLVCRWVCEPLIEERPDLAAELIATGHGLRLLLEDRAAFDQAVQASAAGDVDAFRAVIGSKQLFPFCRLICEWFCSLRCVWVCLTLCRKFPPQPIEQPLKEAFAFAQATGSLSGRANALRQLSAAVGAGDEQAFTALVTELKLERFCIQLCHWICFLRCRRFCIPVCPPEGLFPIFTSIGVYDYVPDINSTVGGNGLTVADDRAFFQTLRLNGILTQTLGGQPMEYRFETRPTDAAGNPLGPGTWSPVLPAQIARTEIGKWERFDFITMTLKTKKYTVNGTAGPNEVVAPIAADGWIKVPQENNWLSPAGAFFPNGNMIELISNSLDPFPPQNETGTIAGGPAAHALAEDKYFGIRMRVRQVGVPLSETDGGTCDHVAIDNTLYDNITLHPDWDGGLQPPGQLAVRMLDIDELITKPCSEITNSLTVLFTAAHPNLGSVGITMTGPGGPYNFTLPAIPEVGDWYGTATPTFNVASLKPCAYLVTLEITVLLTNGDDYPSALYDQIAFCKK